MNPDIKARWVAALRNPEAEQIKGQLGNPEGGRCCLGVLCDIAVEDGVIDPPRSYGASDELEYAESTSSLPGSVQEWADLDSDNPLVGESDPDPTTGVTTAYGAIWANDRLELTFSEIADLIERNL